MSESIHIQSLGAWEGVLWFHKIGFMLQAVQNGLQLILGHLLKLLKCCVILNIPILVFIYQKVLKGFKAVFSRPH